LGNVETELAVDNEANGCGCAYPESVPDEDVARSNEILAQLRATVRRAESRRPGLRARLAALPMHRVARIGDARIGIVHGDAWALAGWQFAHDSLHAANREATIAAAFEQAALDGFASTHTCLPALKVFDTGLGERFVINNGSAGMPNFRGSRAGLITRSRSPLPPPGPTPYGAIPGCIRGCTGHAVRGHVDRRVRAIGRRYRGKRLLPARIIVGPIFNRRGPQSRRAASAVALRRARRSDRSIPCADEALPSASGNRSSTDRNACAARRLRCRFLSSI
jgi:hypothetical protein